MIFRRSTRQLFTDQGVLIKRLDCPKGGMGNVDITRNPEGVVMCAGCRREIMDTAGKGEDELMVAVAKDPNICFMLDLRRCRIVI